MHTETTKSTYLNIRVSKLSKNILQKAAEIEGDTLSHFVVSQALESAYKLLSKPETLLLSSEEQHQFYHLLEDPKELNPYLSKAIQRYKKIKKDVSEV
jgi:uncharacterized protein (DUF1778 family)